MSGRLNEIIDAFIDADPELRAELLIDYSRRLPALPERLKAERDAGLHRVPECQTPVFLWVEYDGRVHIHADVAEEAPTVKGFVSLLAHAFEGATPDEVAGAPSDLVQQLGLAELVRMTRAIGLSAVLNRIKREVARRAEVSATEGVQGHERRRPAKI